MTWEADLYRSRYGSATELLRVGGAPAPSPSAPHPPARLLLATRCAASAACAAG